MLQLLRYSQFLSCGNSLECIGAPLVLAGCEKETGDGLAPTTSVAPAAAKKFVATFAVMSVGIMASIV
jgi:hypothetical protein